MDRNQAKEFYPFLQAFAEGKAIECRTKPSVLEGTDVPNDWTEMKEIEFWNNTEYRVKSEPKFRPFKDAEECWQEMLKHHPLGFVKDKQDGHYVLITCVNDDTCGMSLNGNAAWSLSGIMDLFTFADGVPFGVKVEE